MKLRNLFIAAVAGLFGLVACEGVHEEFGTPQISVTPTELSFKAEGGQDSIELKANRDWEVDGEIPSWIGLSVQDGSASSSAQKITVTADPNVGKDGSETFNREEKITFSIGTKKAVLAIKQKGGLGEFSVEPGAGTLEDPYSVMGVVAYVNKLGKDVQSEEEVYVKGIVSSIEEAYTPSFGNATFYITDNGKDDSDDRFYVFRIKFLNNAAWEVGNSQIAVGDEVVIRSRVVNYQGTKPETVMLGKNAEGGPYAGYLYSLNGKTEEEKAEIDYENAPAKTVDEFIQAADKANYYKLTGKVSKFNAQYCSFDLTDESGTIYVYSVANKSEWSDKIADGGTVVLAGLYDYYESKQQHEVVKAQILSFEAAEVIPASQANPVGDGSQANPFNVSAAVNAVKDLTWTANDNYDKVGPFYVAGKVKTVKEAFGEQFGNGTFVLVDDGFDAEFTAFRILYIGNKKWAAGDASVAVGDEIVVYASLLNYKGNTPETVSGDGYLYSLNGQTSIAQSPVFGVDKTGISVGASAVSATINVTGNVAWTAASNDATVAPASGEGAGAITVSFPANEDTENAKTYTVIVSTTADVDAKSITVTITQAKATPAGASGWYKKSLSDLNTGDVVVIVSENASKEVYAMSHGSLNSKKAPNAVKVTVADEAISDPDTGLQWTVTVGNGEYTFSSDGSNNLYSTNDNNGLRVGSGENNVFVIDSDYLKNKGTARYIGVYNSTDWRSYTSINSNIKDQVFYVFVKQ